MRRTVRNTSLVLGSSLVVLCGLMSGGAMAAFSHSTVDKTFSAGPGCVSVTDIAVVESTGTVYVVCVEATRQVIRKFDLNGNPVPFSASKPYISGNEIIESP